MASAVSALGRLHDSQIHVLYHVAELETASPEHAVLLSRSDGTPTSASQRRRTMYSVMLGSTAWQGSVNSAIITKQSSRSRRPPDGRSSGLRYTANVHAVVTLHRESSFPL